LFYLDLLLTVIGGLVVLYLFFLNVIKKFSFNLNRVFIVISFLTANFFIVQFLLLIMPETFSGTILGKLSIGIVILSATIMFNLVLIYPEAKIKGRFIAIILSAIPGYVVTYLAVGTDLIVNRVAYEQYIIYYPGRYFLVNGFTIMLYLIAVAIVTIYKIVTLRNRVLSRELLYLIVGVFLLFSILHVSSWILPLYYEIYQYRIIGISFSWTLIMVLLNYVVFDITKIDFKRFYINAFSWFLIVVLLMGPALLAVKLNYRYGDKYFLPAPALAVLIFIYSFLFYKFAKPGIIELFQTGIQKLRGDLKEFFIPLSRLSHDVDQGEYWENYFDISIREMAAVYRISAAYYFEYNSATNNYTCKFKIGDGFPGNVIDDESLLSCLAVDQVVVDTSRLHSDITYARYREEALQFYKDNDIEIIIPFFDHDNRLIAFLMLGHLPRKKLYERTFIEALELYRVQFQYHLVNEKYLEHVKQTQLMEHDRIVVDTIKKKIIPKSIRQIRGVRVSSFHIDLSDRGGDYFDSILIGSDRLCLFIADAEYRGVDSALLALELYTILHTPAANYASPEKILNSMNRIISTSKVSQNYSPAFCLMISSNMELQYSNAAYNPLMVYNPQNRLFNSLDVKGIPLGVELNFKFTSKSVQLTPGSIGILYSSGLISAVNKYGDGFTLERIQSIVKSSADATPAVLTRKIYSAFIDFADREKLTDDASLIIFRV